MLAVEVEVLAVDVEVLAVDCDGVAGDADVLAIEGELVAVEAAAVKLEPTPPPSTACASDLLREPSRLPPSRSDSESDALDAEQPAARTAATSNASQVEILIAASNIHRPPGDGNRRKLPAEFEPDERRETYHGPARGGPEIGAAMASPWMKHCRVAYNQNAKCEQVVAVIWSPQTS